MADHQATVFVIDDDPSIRDALDSLIRSVGLSVRSFGSPAEFLRHGPPDAPACLVLDVRMPGSSGLDFHRELRQSAIELPIIFITGHGDIPMAVEAMKAGAIEFLTKPFRDQDLLDAIQRGLALSRTHNREKAANAGIKQRFEELSPRERQIMAFVVAGPAEQADRRRASRQRDHREGPSRPVDAQDAGAFAGRPGPDRGSARCS